MTDKNIHKDTLLIDRELLERIDESAICDGTDATISDDLFTQLVAALAAPRQPEGYALVPVEPTPEMVSAAEEAHMPFGDMDIALRMAILSAPSAPATVQGVNSQLLDALEHARLFIRNGVELGFITMPDADCPDPAHNTLPRIEAAIAAARKGEVE